ncbi:UPF0175 family protein [Marichromatium gracile]|uniref:Uncharacterized protein n=1 Tax=Marichromatium gracile TaxID=1048 RepID=A0ABR5VL15_MARGR|nr:UPF0175 family protein [Marichromatium gracile]KXX66259.1 hypothetical protein AY586_05770 [Marichromatium gracile]
MSQLILDVPDETLRSLRFSNDTAATETRLAAAMKLNELGRLSAGGAARLAGVPRTVFLSCLADYGIATFVLSEDEIAGQAPLG